MPNLQTTLAFVAFLAVLAGATAPAQECPELIGIWPYGPIRNVGAGEGGTVCILNGAALQVLDVDDPSAPVVIGEVAIPNSYDEQFEVRGDRVYVSESGALGIVDLADPSAPVRVGGFRYSSATGLRSHFLDASGDRAYVFDDVLRILDVSNPSNPRSIGVWEAPAGSIVGFAGVEGAVVYASSHPQGSSVSTLHVLDATQPATPVELGSLGFAVDILGVAAGGDLVYVLTESGLSIVDVANASQPTIVGSLALPNPIHFGGWSRRMARIASSVYVNLGGGISIIDVSDPQHPVEVGSLRGGACAVVPGYCYLAMGADGFLIVDVSDPSSPVELGALPGMDLMLDIDVQGGFGAIAGGHDGLRLLDFSDPAHPAETAVLPLADCPLPGDNFVYRVVLSDHLAFAATDPCFWIVDVSDPFAPASLSTPLLPGNEFAVEGPFIYLCDAVHQSLTVVDASDPVNPVQTGMVGGDAACEYVDVEYERAYATSSPGLTVVDVSDPADPFILGTAQSPPPSDVCGVAASGQTAVRIAIGWLHFFDAFDPAHPFEAAAIPLVGLGYDVAMGGDYAVARCAFGLKVINAAHPEAPFEAGSAEVTPFDRVAVEGSTAYTLQYSSGVRIYDLSGCDAIVFRDDFESGDTSRWPATVP